MGTKSKKNKKEKKKKRIRGAAAKNRAEKHKSGFQSTSVECPEGTERFKEKAGGKGYRLDIIPFVLKESNDYADKGEQYYEKTIWVHFNIGADKTAYVCPSKMLGEKCPICQFRAKLDRKSDSDDDLIKDLAPKQRQLFRIIDTKDRDKGIQLWEISFHNFGKMLDARVRNSDDDDRYDEFYELEDGFTLKIAFEEASFGSNKFPKAESIDFKSRKEDYDNNMLEEGPDLDECVKILDYDELKAIFLQTTDLDDDDDDDDDDKKDKKSKKSKKDKDDNDDDDDDSGDDDDDNWEKNDRVIVEVNGEDYPGKLTSIDDDDKTANIEFDDGDTMEDVPFDDLQAEPEKKNKSKKDKGKKEKGKKEKGKSGKKCPGGGTFGKDTDRLTECPDCPKWDACDDAD